MEVDSPRNPAQPRRRFIRPSSPIELLQGARVPKHGLRLAYRSLCLIQGAINRLLRFRSKSGRWILRYLGRDRPVLTGPLLEAAFQQTHNRTPVGALREAPAPADTATPSSGGGSGGIAQSCKRPPYAFSKSSPLSRVAALDAPLHLRYEPISLRHTRCQWRIPMTI